MWLIELGDLWEGKKPNRLNLTYRIFGDKYFLFSENHLAVDTIRKLMDAKGFKERWIDVDWNENHEEYVTYLFFIKEKQELGVWFRYHKIDKLVESK